MTDCRRSIHLMVLSAAMVCPVGVVAAAQSQPPAQEPDSPRSSGLRPVRVQLAGRAGQFRVRADGTLYVLNEDGVRVDSISATGWQTIEHRASGEVRIGVKVRSTPFVLEAEAAQAITVSIRRGGKWSDERHSG